MLGKLAPCRGGPPIPLLKPRLVVGRQSWCDIPLSFATVSSRHCELERTEGYWFVRDLGSRNGTHVNGTACQSQWLLPNDVLGVASYRYTVLYTPPPGRPPPGVVVAAARLDPPLPAAAGDPAPDERPAGPSRPNAGAGPTLGKLVPCGGGPPIWLRQTRVVVGRHETCDIVLRSGVVSGRHCELQWTDPGWFVRDLHSRHGIRVDGVHCEEQALPPGSVLWIAGLRFQVVYTCPSGEPAPGQKHPLFEQSLLEKAGLERWPPKSAIADDDPTPRRYTLDEPG